jgi:hypothetical protein
MNQSEEGWLLLRPRPNNIYGDRILISILTFWQTMTMFTCERCGKEFTEKRNLTRHMKTRRFLTDLFLWVCDKMFCRADNRNQKQTWRGPQLQLDLRSMRSVLQQNEQPSTPSCPARETRDQAETTDEETSITWIRTQPKADTYRVITTQNSHGESCWTRRVARGHRDQIVV